MATPTLSLATMGSSRKKLSNSSKSPQNEDKSKESVLSSSSPKLASNKSDKKFRKFWGEEVNDDSIYSIYLKKINYSFNCDELNTKLKIESNSESNSDCVTRCDQTDSSINKKSVRKTIWYDEQQSLQWETRQMRIIKAATLDHIVKYILFLTPHQQQNNQISNCNTNLLEEERNNVAHAMHVLFCTYRLYHYPYELFVTIVKYMQNCCSKQFIFIIHYWLDNYPEDFRTSIHIKSDDINSVIENSSEVSSSNSDSDLSHLSELSSSTTSSDNMGKDTTLIDRLLSLPNIDERIYRKCLDVIETTKETSPDIISTNQKSISKSSSVLELDPRFIAQQITAIDLENFLSLKPYSLLFTSRSKSKLQNMIRNFNLLSRHVIITILKAHSPHIVTSHWIEVALQLRKIRNFNSLKAIIAGLTNEAIYRLKQSVWTKISRASMSTFKWLSTIVDDVNNQTLLRHTQLIIEGTSKVSLEDESFGTIPYLGTFLTDITMINTRYSSYIQSQSDLKLINFEKCSQQYEILMQIQLLQKNVIAALTAIQQQTQQIGRSYLPSNRIFTPTIPRVARIFRIWFQSNDIELITDKQCYEMSLALETSPIKIK